MLRLLKVIVDVVLSDHDERNRDILRALAVLDNLDDRVDARRDLAYAILKDSTLQLAVLDHLKRMLVAVNTDADDVAAAHAVAGSLRRGRHIVVVADDRHELIAILSNIVFSRGRRQVALSLGVLITDHLELIVRIKDVVHALGSLDLCAVSKHAVAVQILAAVRAVIKNPLSQKLAGVDIV